MSHSRKYVIAFLPSETSLTAVSAAGLSLSEAAAWLESHGRAPSPDGQPCIVLQPAARAARPAALEASGEIVVMVGL